MSMPAPLRITLTEDERRDLERRFEAPRAAETRRRYQLVLLAAAGRTASQIAPLVRRRVDTVQRVLRRYRDEGPRGCPTDHARVVPRSSPLPGRRSCAG
jgi:hypothetical protein